MRACVRSPFPNEVILYRTASAAVPNRVTSDIEERQAGTGLLLSATAFRVDAEGASKRED
eukprot:365353-Chlamydomonas_euryale.AAC.27